MKPKTKHKFEVKPEAIKKISEGITGVSVTIDKNYSRKEDIENCDRCGGEPELEPIKLKEFKGSKCKGCLKVYEWEFKK
jgi:hypothetical protein